jgi:PAS domain S-box-containing protein
VESHRAAIMSKIGVSSVVELVRLTAGSEPCRDHAELMLKAYPGLVSFWDKNLIGKFANAPAESPFTQYVDVIVGNTMQNVFGMAFFNRSLPYIRGVLSGEHQQFKQVVEKLSGGLASHVTHYSPHFDADGDVDGFFAFTMDISAARQDAIAFEAAAEVDGEQAQMILDEDCTILSVNPAFTHVTRYSAEEALGQTPVIIKPTGMEQATYIAFWKGILAERFWRGTLWYRRRDGYLFRCRQSVTVERRPGQQPLCHALFSEFTIPPAH